MAETLRYNVDLDTSGLQSQLQTITSGVTAGLNTTFAGVGTGVGIVNTAGEHLRRDLAQFFGPPQGASAYQTPLSTNALSAHIPVGMQTMGMQQMGGFQGQAPNIGLGAFTEADIVLAGGLGRGLARGAGDIFRGLGFENRLGRGPRTMTEQQFQQLARESFQERFAAIKREAITTGGGALLGGAIGTALGLPFGAAPVTGFIGATIGGALGGPIEEFFNPGAQLGRDITATSRALRVGGNQAFTAGQREAFGAAVGQAFAGDPFFRGGEVQQGLVAAVESGAISRRGGAAGNPQALAREFKGFMQNVKEAMQSIHVEFEDALGVVSQIRSEFKMSAQETTQFTQGAATRAGFTGRTELQEVMRQTQMGTRLQQFGMDPTLAGNLAGTRLNEAEAMMRTGMVTGFEARQLGGAVGVGAVGAATEAAFVRTPLGRAALMSEFLQGPRGAANRRLLQSGDIGLNEFMQPIGRASMGDILSFMGQERQFASTRGTGVFAAVAVDALRKIGEEPTPDKVAGILTQIIPGIDSVQAHAAAEQFRVQQQGYEGALFGGTADIVDPNTVNPALGTSTRRMVLRGVISDHAATLVPEDFRMESAALFGGTLGGGETRQRLDATVDLIMQNLERNTKAGAVVSQADVTRAARDGVIQNRLKRGPAGLRQFIEGGDLARMFNEQRGLGKGVLRRDQAILNLITKQNAQALFGAGTNLGENFAGDLAGAPEGQAFNRLLGMLGVNTPEAEAALGGSFRFGASRDAFVAAEGVEGEILAALELMEGDPTLRKDKGALTQAIQSQLTGIKGFSGTAAEIATLTLKELEKIEDKFGTTDQAKANQMARVEQVRQAFTKTSLQTPGEPAEDKLNKSLETLNGTLKLLHDHLTNVKGR